jgi:malic enzyme
MAKDPILFPMANPTPEIMPDLAREAGAAVVGTGRSDFPNQINNVLAYPGIFRGAFDVRASIINEEMKMAAAKALADDFGLLYSGGSDFHGAVKPDVFPGVGSREGAAPNIPDDYYEKLRERAQKL